MGATTPGRTEIAELRRYLLGQLTQEEEEQVEVRLLTEAAYAEEFDMMVDEITDQYVRAELPDSERQQAQHYFFKSAERQDKLRFAEALQCRHTSSHDIWWKGFFRGSLAIAASLLIVAGLALGLWWRYGRQSEVDKGLVAFQAAFRNQRPTEARISPLNSYAPYSQTRGPGKNATDPDELRLAELKLLEAGKSDKSPRLHQALGAVYLAKQQFDDALREFDQALKGDPRNPKLLSDLGAAWLEKGKDHLQKTRADRSTPEAGKGYEELGQSLGYIDQALELDPNLLDALFNRGLCHQSMTLRDQAENDWREYLKKDSTSQWAEEARRNLKELEVQDKQVSRTATQLLEDFVHAYQTRDDDTAWGIISQGHTSAGNTTTNALVDSLVATDPGAPERIRTLKILAYAGQLTRQRSGDLYVSDLAAFYRQTPSARHSALAQARAALTEGYELFKESRLSEAIGSYTTARELFQKSGDLPETVFAEYRLGHCILLQQDLAKGQVVFEQLSVVTRRKQYRWLLAQSLYGLANIRVGLNEYSTAIEESNRALDLSQQIGDVNGVVKILVQLADEYRSLNNATRSLAFLERSLMAMQSNKREPMLSWGTYIAIALNLDALGLHSAALDFQKEALAMAIGRPLITSRTYRYLGLAYGNLNQYDQGIASIQRALEIGRALGPEPNGVEMVANAYLELGDLYRQVGNYSKAITAFDQSLALYSRLNFQHFAYAAHKGKLLSYLAQGNDAAANTEIEIVFELFRQFRSKIPDQSQRNSFFAAKQDLYDLAIDFEYSRMKDPERAFDYAESSHARSLLDIIRQGSRLVDEEFGPELRSESVSNPATLAQIKNELPSHVQVLHYAVLTNKVLIWVVTKSDRRTANQANAEVRIDAQALNQKVRDYLYAIKHDDGANQAVTSEKAKELYSLLIKPVEADLDSESLICIVPDKILSYVPFAALVSPTSGRFLIEDYAVQFAPSVGVFLDCSRIAAAKPKPDNEKLLSIGNPTFDRAVFPTLADLPSAAREARTVAKSYSSPRRLIGDAATAVEVKRGIESANVVHFAGHYLANDGSEMLSELVMAREPANTHHQDPTGGALRAFEIYKMKLAKVRLVVLSACNTGIERNYEGEGAVGLARPFIAAQVPLVVASLWTVDSDATAELMIKFHQHRIQDRLPTVKALRLAQVEMLSDTNARHRQPYYWAGFAAIGGYAEF